MHSQKRPLKLLSKREYVVQIIALKHVQWVQIVTFTHRAIIQSPMCHLMTSSRKREYIAARGCSHLVFLSLLQESSKTSPLFVDYELKFDSHSHISRSSIAVKHTWRVSNSHNVTKALSAHKKSGKQQINLNNTNAIKTVKTFPTSIYSSFYKITQPLDHYSFKYRHQKSFLLVTPCVRLGRAQHQEPTQTLNIPYSHFRNRSAMQPFQTTFVRSVKLIQFWIRSNCWDRIA